VSLSNDLADRRAVVVGASSGVGLAVALALADAGMQVDAAARRREAVDEALEGKVASHQVDVTDRSAVEHFRDEVCAKGPVHALILAAGANVPQRRFDTLKVTDWDLLLSTNLTGAFDVIRAFLGPLRETRGVAIVVGSVSGLWPDSSGAAYQATKAGLLAMARAVALEEHSHGVRVTTLLPGMIDTPLIDQRPVIPPPSIRKQMLAPSDIATACLFILSLPSRAYVPELTILPTALQALGATDVTTVVEARAD
jgi:NAD(P)-dependent dehydrogenase (short-subunit alcohol dehydrogenase family)